MKICVFCAKEFEPTTNKHVCCSKLCNVKKWRKENPEKSKVNEHRAEEKRRGKRVYSSEYRKQWYSKKKKDADWVKNNNKISNERARLVKIFISEYKVKRGCCDCGYNKHHSALDFDHIIGNKELNVSHSKSVNQAIKEIEKCEVVCSNCHRIRTYNRLYPCKPEIFEQTYELVEQ